jgi:hypothetical protein
VIVPVAQREYRFLQALIERRTDFRENIFYDVSAWCLPLAFDLQEEAVDRDPEEWMDRESNLEFARSAFSPRQADLAYLIDWRGYFAPRTLSRLLGADVLVKAALSPVSIQGPTGPEAFDRGALLIPLGVQPEKREQIQQILTEAADADGVRIVGTASGLTPDGIDLGSSRFVVVPKPAIAVLVGDGVGAYEAGEIWHLLDRRYHIPLTLLDVSQLGSADLSKYTTIVLPGGRYASVPDQARNKLRSWVEAGGTLIAQTTACQWIADVQLVPLKLRPKSKRENQPLPYAEANDRAALENIAGAIFQVQVDTTHPLAFGLPSQLAVFRDHELVMEPLENPYATPLRYSESPLLCGYASQQNRDRLASSASAQSQGLGRGRIVLLADNANFRAYWYGTNRLFLNAVFYAPLVRDRAGEDSLEE